MPLRAREREYAKTAQLAALLDAHLSATREPLTAVAARAGCSPRALFKIQREEVPWTPILMADALLCALGRHVSELDGTVFRHSHERSAIGGTSPARAAA